MAITHIVVRMAICIGMLAGAAKAGSTMTGDIEYGRVGEKKLLLDAYVPAGDGPFPIVIYVHGGGWSSGDKRADTQLLEPLRATDVVLLSIDYRLAPADRWPACFDDVSTAIKWAKANAAKYKGDPKRIALSGYSAGGQLAFLAAVTAKEETAVQAVIGFAPPTDLELDLPTRGGLSKSLQDLLNRPQSTDDAAIKQLRELSAIHFVHPGLPPFLILHGSADKSVPYEGSVNFQKAVQAAGGACDLFTLKNAPHRIRDWKNSDPAFGKKITDWLSLAMSLTKATQP